jgi:coatomer protein complex subunit epsilon
MADELYEVRNAVVLGNFHQAIAEGNNAKPSSKKPEDVQAFNADRDLLVAKAQIGLGQFDVVAHELRTATHPLLVAAGHWATFNKDIAQGGSGDAAAAELIAVAGVTPKAELAPVAMLAAVAQLHKADITGAMRLSSTWAAAIDAETHPREVLALRAVAADALLRFNRVDLADRELSAMKKIDDDAVLTLLTTATVCLRQGATSTPKFREAQTAAQEITMRCGQSVSMLNLLALAQLGQGNAADAERSLLDALAKRSGDADTIANLAVVSAQLAKPTEATQRYVGQAKAAAPHAPWSKTHSAMEQRFRDAAATVA